MGPSLVILAAGVGSRYGGTKQLEAVDSTGRTLMEYSIYDAWRAGFEHIIMVIREDMREKFQNALVKPLSQHVAVDLAFQNLDALPTGFTPPQQRIKPWGTGQAVLAARDLIDGPFAVINADDFYGAGAFRETAAFLVDVNADTSTYSLVAYPLSDTLSETGAVSRALCRLTSDGWLENIVEVPEIHNRQQNGHYVDPNGAAQMIPGDTPVSMNMWGFTPQIFSQLDNGFADFLNRHIHSPVAEFLLPSEIGRLLTEGQARVKVLESPDKWCGVTHPDDRLRVVQIIDQLVRQGAYPAALWAE